MLLGERVNLRAFDLDDLDFIWRWGNDLDYMGPFEQVEQFSRLEAEKWLREIPNDECWFIVEDKAEGKVGQIVARPEGPHYAIGYRILPAERGKGYCTEAVKILVDYLFLSKTIVRVQAQTNPENTASIRVLEKAGFVREGKMRKALYACGRWLDGLMYSILREEWKGPEILKRGDSL